MLGVLLATDSDSVFRTIDAAIADDDTVVWRVRRGADVLAVIDANQPAMVILDMQIGNMGGVATCASPPPRRGADRIERRPVGLLLDRADDVFLAKQAGADAWVTKPLDVLALKRFIAALTASAAVDATTD
ncbi:MAG: response regulator [Acidimicrobiales bacterium]